MTMNELNNWREKNTILLTHFKLYKKSWIPTDYFRYHEKRTRSSAPLVPIEEIAVDRLSLTLGDLLHEGTFGRIYQGRLDIDCDSEDVMVKTVVMGSSPHQTDKLGK